ncbi:MAG TPA: transcription termination factor NusA [Anaerohalosphaeraceae bacterium]|nr:transcription termination factor NusA [Anaerohalosphaeraceae bacterium]
MNQELLRIVENIARDKNIDKESIFQDLEAAMISAARKHFSALKGAEVEVVVRIDRNNGEIAAWKDDTQIDIRQLGRIPAQTAKQVMIQKIRQDERESIFSEYAQRKGEIITGIAGRYDGGVLVINLNSRVEAIMPKSEQISGETHHPGDRIRCMILDVRETNNQVKIILSRTHPEFIRRLFEQEVPEVAENIIEIKALAREAGYRTKIAVESTDDKVDPVGACVGIRGSRIRNIVDELGGEKIDIVKWSDSSQALIANALMPAKVSEIAICFELGKATVVVTEDQLSLAIGKHGQNVRLAARLTGWDIDILTPEEYNREVERLAMILKDIPGMDDRFVDKLLALGIISALDLEDVGTEPLIAELGIDKDRAGQILQAAAQAAKQAAADGKATQAESLIKEQQKKRSRK